MAKASVKKAKQPKPAAKDLKPAQKWAQSVKGGGIRTGNNGGG